MTFDPHPPRVVRPDKAPPLLMTKAQKLEALAAGRRAGRGDRALHARAVALGSGDVRAHGARRLAARRRRCGSARTSCSATIAPATSRCCATLGAPLRVQGREDRSGPLQGLRRQQHARSAGWSAKGAWTRRARCSATSTSSTARSCAATSAAARSAFRRRTCAPRTSCCRRTASTRRRRRSTGSCYPSVTNIGVAADGRRVRAGPSIETHIFDFDRGSLRRADPRRVRAAAARRAGVRVARRAARADRRRLRPRARAVRSPFTVESRVVADHDFFFALDVSGDAACRPDAGRAGRAPCSGTSATPRSAIDALTGAAAAARSPDGASDGKRRCDVQFRVRSGTARDRRVRRPAAAIWRTSWPLPDVLIASCVSTTR